MKSGFHLLHRREGVGHSLPHEHLRPNQLSTGCSVKVCKDQQMMASSQGYRDPGLHRQESHAQVLQGRMETMSNQHFLRSRCRVSRRKCKVCRAWLLTSSSCALLGSLSGTKDQCS